MRQHNSNYIAFEKKISIRQSHWTSIIIVKTAQGDFIEIDKNTKIIVNMYNISVTASHQISLQIVRTIPGYRA